MDAIASRVEECETCLRPSRPEVATAGTSAHTRVGRTIGPYRVVEQIGAGGMGVVYRAEDTRLGREVALKFLAPNPSCDDGMRRRFDAEARSASALSHPNICTIYEVGQDGEAPFLVMELLKGRTLRDRLAAGPLPLSDCLAMAMAMADALDAAHGQHIVHLDLKPRNIFVTERGTPKLLDFGLARVVASPFAGARPDDRTQTASVNLTEPHRILGTPAYMSPEQVRGLPLDRRTDLFSFGAVLYEMATGRAAFEGATTGVVLESVLVSAPVNPRILNADCPAVLGAVITKALEKDRALRYQSARELLADLKRVRDESGEYAPAGASGRLRIRAGVSRI